MGEGTSRTRLPIDKLLLALMGKQKSAEVPHPTHQASAKSFFHAMRSLVDDTTICRAKVQHTGFYWTVLYCILPASCCYLVYSGSLYTLLSFFKYSRIARQRGRTYNTAPPRSDRHISCDGNLSLPSSLVKYRFQQSEPCTV